MKTKIVVVLVAVAFVTGMMVQSIPASATDQGKKNEKSSNWIRVAQIWASSVNQLEAANKHFHAPTADMTPPPDDSIPELLQLLEEIEEQTTQIQHKKTDWEFILERAD